MWRRDITTHTNRACVRTNIYKESDTYTHSQQLLEEVLQLTRPLPGKSYKMGFTLLRGTVIRADSPVLSAAL